MSTNHKAKGSRSERKVRDHYAAQGFYVCKAGGSLGAWDLICVHPDHRTLLVQVKTNRPPGRPEMDVLRNFQVGDHCRKILAIVRDYRGISFSEV